MLLRMTMASRSQCVLTTPLHAPMQVSGLKFKVQGTCSGPARKDLTSKIKKAAKDKINKDEKDFVFSAKQLLDFESVWIAV